MNSVGPHDGNADRIPVEIIDTTSTNQELTVKMSLEKEEGKYRSSGEQKFKGFGSSIKLLQILGLPTFNSEDIDSQGITKLKMASCWNALYMILVIGISVCSTFIFTLVPLHNQVEFPNNWYQLVLLWVFSTPWYSTLDIIPFCYYCFKAEYMISHATFFRLFIPTALGFVIPYVSLMLIWTQYLGYNPPLPFCSTVKKSTLTLMIPQLHLYPAFSLIHLLSHMFQPAKVQNSSQSTQQPLKCTAAAEVHNNCPSAQQLPKCTTAAKVHSNRGVQHPGNRKCTH